MTTSTTYQTYIQLYKDDPKRAVGFCDEHTDCDDLKFEWPTEPSSIRIITSSESGKRFLSKTQNFTPPSSPESSSSSSSTSNSLGKNIDFNMNDKKQKIMGWGGAFTDSACYHITKAGPILGDKLIASYYGPKGLRYNFGRVPIAGSDFSLRPYTYDDTLKDTPDFELDNWSLATEDIEYKIPVIQRAIQLSEQPVKLFASPWSPPAWMKTNKDIRRGHLIDDDRIYECYARYLIKFFDAYRSQGLEFWGATLQNEPGSSYFPFYFFNSLQFSPSEMIKFLSKFYGPALEASNRTKENFKLIIGDDSLGFINYQVPIVMLEPEAAKYISGLAFHWYTSKTLVSYNQLNSLYEIIKDKIEFVMMSEACTGSIPTSRGVKLGNWDRGSQYASDIIEDLKRHTSSWIDWNIVLDKKGGPNWSDNFVDSPIIIDHEKKLFYKQPMYYALAHFSRFFLPDCSVLIPTGKSEIKGLSYIACHVGSTNHLVVNILNLSNKKNNVTVLVNTEPKTNDIEIEPKSITSVIIKM